jgi:DNA replication protein DnaC
MATTTVNELVEKMKASGRYHPISEDEYKRLYCEQMAKVYAEQAATFKPDYALLGIREDEAGLNWGAIQPNVSDGMKALQAVKPAYERGWGMVFLWGNYGQAKTLIGKILTATAFRDGKRAAYANMSSVLDNIRLAFDEQEHKTTELLRRMDFWINRDVLFLDELDKCNDTQWAQERMFQLLDQRYTRAIREEALTVIASNKSNTALDGYLNSRLKDRRLGPVVHLDGKDGRQVMPEGYRY